MYCRIKGTCVFIAEPRKFQVVGKPERVVKEFSFLVTAPKVAPEIVKVISFNGFAPKLNEVSEFDARVSVRKWGAAGKEQVQLSVEVL